MAERRHKDSNWFLPDQFTWEHVPVALLMDIRDELKKLNAVFECRNFLQIPSNIDALVQFARREERRRRPRRITAKQAAKVMARRRNRKGVAK